MKKVLTLLACLILLAGCGAKSIPDWTNAAFNHMERYKQDYLSGKSDTAELHFNKATDEIRRSGDLDILARAYLTKYAVQTAVLEKIDDRNYLMIESAQSSSVNKNYHKFLKGDFDHVGAELLPEQYRNIFTIFRTGKTEAIADELMKIEDLLARLIASGLTVQYSRYDERCLQIAIDTAMKNGWKKPLLIYLERLKTYYETVNDPGKASAIQKKIELIKR